MISNPATIFVTGSDRRDFTFAGGKYLYHFSPRDNGLCEHMNNNFVFFADSVDHALMILDSLCNFRIRCSKEYTEWTKQHRHYNEQYAEDQHDRIVTMYQGYLDAIEAGQVKIELAPTDQVYQVGWASNDTIT